MIIENNKKKTVLIVDDEAEICRLLSRILAKAGYNTLSAFNGMEALVKAQDNKIDLVITDIRMPGISGLDLVKQLHDLNPQLPVIVITGYGGQSTALESMERGAFFFIKKPFESGTLLNVVAKGMRLPHLSDQACVDAANVSHSVSFSFAPSLDVLEGINCQVSAAVRQMGYSPPFYSMMVPFVIDELLENAIAMTGGDKASDIRMSLNVEITFKNIVMTFKSGVEAFDSSRIPKSFDEINISNSDEVGLMLLRHYSDQMDFSENRKKVTLVIENKELN